MANHYIEAPVRFWSHEGSDGEVLCVLAERRFGDLPRFTLSAGAVREQSTAAVAAALNHLRAVATPTGTGIGAASTAGLDAIPSMSCGMRSTATWTCTMPPRVNRDRFDLVHPGARAHADISVLQCRHYE